VNQVRGLVPWPGAFTYLPGHGGALLKIWQAKIDKASGVPGEILQVDRDGIAVGCGEGSLKILSLQREGARRLTPQQFIAGHPLTAGQRLGSETDVLR
jgi:methionyl-tRNA formyltransferase